jgi:isocitrate dehydrogenase
MKPLVKTPITVAHGDGIGPDIMTAVLRILDAAGAALDIRTIEVGEKVYLRGNSRGIDPEGWDALRQTRVFLKAPISTPQGGGYKSLNVAARKALGLYANVRPCVSYAPYVQTLHPKMDLVIIRENEEDLYAGIEYGQTPGVMACLKVITRPACERIVRYAFEYARTHGRRKVTCMTKDNIMKLTDGLFHKVFDEISPQYPDIASEHWIVDIGAAKLADTPELFDVVVVPNLYGDILSDITAQITGSVGLVGTANIGTQCAMFEAIHGSAPRAAGQDRANPSALLLAAVQMLVYIGQQPVAERVHNAWLRTLEEGIHTPDVYDAAVSKARVGTLAFTQAVIDRIGQQPQHLPVAHYPLPQASSGASAAGQVPAVSLGGGAAPLALAQERQLVGLDVFVEYEGADPAWLATVLEGAQKAVPAGALVLQSLSNRGVEVWPAKAPHSLCVPQYQCRFLVPADVQPAPVVTLASLHALLQAIDQSGLHYVKTEHLYTFDGRPGYSGV